MEKNKNFCESRYAAFFCYIIPLPALLLFYLLQDKSKNKSAFLNSHIIKAFDLSLFGYMYGYTFFICLGLGFCLYKISPTSIKSLLFFVGLIVGLAFLLSFISYVVQFQASLIKVLRRISIKKESLEFKFLSEFLE